MFTVPAVPTSDAVPEIDIVPVSSSPDSGSLITIVGASLST